MVEVNFGACAVRDARVRDGLARALEAMRSVSIFVMSKERINRPTGEAWWREEIEAAEAALSGELDPNHVNTPRPTDNNADEWHAWLDEHRGYGLPYIAVQIAEALDDAGISHVLATSDAEVIAEIEAEGRDPEALAEAMRGQMNATFRLCEEVKHWKEEARSWRAVAERLETEKQAERNQLKSTVAL